MLEVVVSAEIEIRVEVAGFDTTVGDDDVAEEVQNAIGHTGAIVERVTHWEPVSE